MFERSHYPLVTFALFAYNQERYIREAVEAAFRQDYPNLEIVLSDDSSTDMTWTVIEDLVQGYTGPHSVRLNRNPYNLGSDGIGSHVNKVVELARGELVVFAAGDDVSRADRTAKLVRMWQEAGSPTGILHSAVQVIDESGVPLRISHGRASYSDLDVADMVRTGGKGALGASLAATRDIYRIFGEIDPHTYFEDRTTAFRAFLAGQILYTDDALVDYRVHGESMTSPRKYTNPAKWERWIEGTLNVFDQFERDYRRSLDRAADPRVLRAIERERVATRRARGIHADSPTMRGWAAWNYGRDMPFRSRVAFAVECAGWIDSLPIRGLRKITRAMR